MKNIAEITENHLKNRLNVILLQKGVHNIGGACRNIKTILVAEKYMIVRIKTKTFLFMPIKLFKG